MTMIPTTHPNLVYAVNNASTLMQARVWLITGRYHVTLLDLESDITLPTIKIFPMGSSDAAIQHARTLVGV
jgi:hypothetical protein